MTTLYTDTTPRRRPLLIIVFVSLTIALVGLQLAALGTGELNLSRQRVLRVLFISRADVGDPSAVPFFVRAFVDEGRASPQDRIAHVVVHDLRLPRALLGAMVGAALALAGVMLQDAMQNVLAEPGILGVSSGAVVVVGVVTVFDISLPAGGLPILALLGGFGAGSVLLTAATLKTHPVRLVLMGASMTAFLNALLIIIISIGDPYDIQLLYRFLVGSLANRTWEAVNLVAPWVAVGIPLALLTARPLNLLQLGDEVAEGLGLSVVRMRLYVFAVSIAMVSAVVSVAGPISFVALLAPHSARRLLRTTDARQVLPVAGLLGAVLLTGADLFARTVVAPVELPVGIFTTIFGAPLLLVLIRREIGKAGR